MVDRPSAAEDRRSWPKEPLGDGGLAVRSTPAPPDPVSRSRPGLPKRGGG
jgi:hypothetical protein